MIKNNFFYKKFFGQNFLIDKSVIKKIVSLIDPKKKELFLEIGPGKGALTFPMCNFLNKLFVIDIDSDVLFFLKKNNFFYKIHFFLQDILTFNYLDFYIQNGKNRIRFFGNLPYNISNKILFSLIKNFIVIKDMHFMLQKEVAERILSKHNTKKYGRLSIIMQYFFHIVKLIDVPSRAFFPSPLVDSIFLKFLPHKLFPKMFFDFNIFSDITRVAFNQRRKTIKNNFKNVFAQDVFLQFNIDPNCRPENISLKKYCQLTDYFIRYNFKNKKKIT
ncbi:16S rRNA (adenine(1518)-N(6)/adenine(1519)-N(6))-dimethyltransferase RsmA [Buchnera aphidicola]|uniref:16S rRNA (adenine(1518)-N(6)/adenine(1519)-N(6))- dimethyltransferase RsmA n=1 Tax=Buchnera aphidicola TaxID=9 RepID=UPI002543DDAB|nr:16S rRNA (adenine(1518)-N(6)/adenine(1519)-N(6))-dimethyltransferase RsmA [Buchnera aphidicola]WII23777.1 16S rRNA (adenine(1518)-N(6)/adenine(1519)-N(6))-dimethyltransferase RsmA [Buchnera aphidicola (Sipha maydis)]